MKTHDSWCSQLQLPKIGINKNHIVTKKLKNTIVNQFAVI